jgi:cell division protein FtsW
MVMGATALALYLLAGAPWRDILLIFVGALVVLGALVMVRPYLMSRVMTFINPAENSLTSGYQIQQSLIAIGSGGFMGRGFGQSAQKFNYLPEPVGDSVFAVYSEEFGFVGAVFMVLLFAGFAARGFAIAADASTMFGSLAATGLTLLISLSAFLNIGAMLAVNRPSAAVCFARRHRAPGCARISGCHFKCCCSPKACQNLTNN